VIYHTEVDFVATIEDPGMNKPKHRYHSTEILSSRPCDPPLTLARPGQQISTPVRVRRRRAPEPSQRVTPAVIGLISIAKQRNGDVGRPDSVLKDTKPKGFPP